MPALSNAKALRGVAAFAFAAVCGPASAQAAGMPSQDVGAAEQRVWFRLGAFHPHIDSRVRIDDVDGAVLGTEFTLERYGLAQRKTLPTGLLGVRLSERWRAEFEYFRLDRSGRAELDRNIVVGDTTFPVRGTLDSHLRTDIGRASLGYSFIRGPQLELGFVGGVHVTRFDILLEGRLAGAGSGAVLQREDEDATVPLPTVGLYGNWGFGSAWALSWRADLLSFKHRQYDGRLSNVQAELMYSFTPNLALGAGARFVDYRLRSSDSDLRGEVKYRFNGPQAFLQFGF